MGIFHCYLSLQEGYIILIDSSTLMDADATSTSYLHTSYEPTGFYHDDSQEVPRFTSFIDDVLGVLALRWDPL